MLTRLRRTLGRQLAQYLARPLPGYTAFATYDVALLAHILQPGDILLVEGDTRISTAIKYLTQSTWSHAAFFAGDQTNRFTTDGQPCPLIEAELPDGVIASPLAKYRDFNLRICRPLNLTARDRAGVVDFMVQSIGRHYDLKHIFDLLRYLWPTPLVPTRYRRRLIALGSGDPSQAICSSLIAESFQSIRYPILPSIEKKTELARYHYREKVLYHIKHYSLFTPRDFDVSPYFQIIKPTIERGFDYQTMILLNPQTDRTSA